MALCFLSFEKSDMSSVRVYSNLHLTSHFFPGTRKHGHVYLVRLYCLQYSIAVYKGFVYKSMVCVDKQLDTSRIFGWTGHVDICTDAKPNIGACQAK